VDRGNRARKSRNVGGARDRLYDEENLVPKGRRSETKGEKGSEFVVEETHETEEWENETERSRWV